MRIAFIVSHLKTQLFFAVAQDLKRHGHEVFWISPSRPWADWLAQNGVAARRVLDLTLFTRDWTRHVPGASEPWAQDLDRLRAASGYPVLDFVKMDRNLRNKPQEYARAYLGVCQRRVRDFLLGNEITAVFAEPTWAVELITSAVCKAQGIEFWAPHTVRIPDGRFAFFEGYLQRRYAALSEPSRADRERAIEFYEYFKQQKPKPRYWHLNNELPRLQANWLDKTRRHVFRAWKDRNRRDETGFPLGTLIKTRLAAFTNSRAVEKAQPFEAALPAGEPFVLYALHKQPESSIDVLGYPHTDQVRMIAAMASSLAGGHELWVKEHRNCIGDRSLKYYETLRSIPNVRLIDPYVDSHDLIRRAQLVVSVSGTIAFEAALHGVRSATVAEMFFGEILTRNGFDPFSRSLRSILENSNKPGETAAVDFLTCLWTNSNEGVISDPRSDPTCLSQENVARVARGFARLLSGSRSRQAAHN